MPCLVKELIIIIQFFKYIYLGANNNHPNFLFSLFCSQERHAAKTIGEMKQFVSKLPHLQATRQSLATRKFHYFVTLLYFVFTSVSSMFHSLFFLKIEIIFFYEV